MVLNTLLVTSMEGEGFHSCLYMVDHVDKSNYLYGTSLTMIAQEEIFFLYEDDVDENPINDDSFQEENEVYEIGITLVISS